MDRPTGENLFSEDTFDFIPGATVFYKLDTKNDSEEQCEQSEGLPSNPQDYLRSVKAEAQRCPDVVVAPISAEKLKEKHEPTLFLQPTLPGQQHAPTKEWCENRVGAFARARQEYVRHLAQLKSIKRQSKKRPKLPIYPLPAWNDETSWKYFCLGNQMKLICSEEEASQNNSVVNSDDEEDAVMDALAASGKKEDADVLDVVADEDPSLLGEENEDLVIDLSSLEEGFPPLLRILLRLEQKQVEANLEFHLSWMKNYGFSNHQGRWIYALMTCLEKPVFPTVTSALRNLSRQCALARTKANASSDEMKGLNLIICIVGKYFGQSDLLDPM